jgi:superfamily II DNA or RNA helicase
VFCEYRDTARHVVEYLNTKSPDKAIAVTGEIADAEKRRVLAVTGGSSKARVRVCTMDSITEGIDLSEARTVIWVEETYVKGQRQQCLARIQRARVTAASKTSTAPIVSYSVRYKGTADSVIYDKIRRRINVSVMDVMREALITEPS